MRHVLFGLFRPKADGASVLRSSASTATLYGVLHGDGERSQHVHFFAVVVFAHSFDAAIDNASHIWHRDGCLCNVCRKDDPRTFRFFKNALLRFSVLPAVQLQEFCCVCSKSFICSGVASGNFSLAWQKYECRLPDVVSVQRAQGAYDFVFDSLTGADIYTGGRFLMYNLYWIKRVPEFETFDSKRLFHFIAVELRAHHGDSRYFLVFVASGTAHRLQLEQVRKEQVHVGFAFVVFIKDDPFRIHFAMQKFLQKVSVCLEKDARVA